MAGFMVAELQPQTAQEIVQVGEGLVRRFLREILASVTEGRLRLCENEDDLPQRLPQAAPSLFLSSRNLRLPREQVGEMAQAQGFSCDRLQELVIAVGEATMNAVVYAGGGTCTMCATPPETPDTEARIQVWIQDFGEGIPLDRLHRATLERGFSTGGSFGHGFWMMLRTADRVHLLTGSNGTTVVLEQSKFAPVPYWLPGNFLSSLVAK